MIETWRWFGPADSITLEKIAQAGAKGVVTSLHEIGTGEVWPLASVLERKALIEGAGLSWSVIESIPVHNDIKTRTGLYRECIEAYKQSLKNVGDAGVDTVCYNFMPVVDWTRTNLLFKLPNQAHALRFEMTDFAAYDIYILQRQNAEQDYSSAVVAKAKSRFERFSEEEKVLLEKNIIAGLPGGEGSYDRDGIREAIKLFTDLGTEGLRRNLFAFLEEVVPVAEAAGVRLCIHPDDPPFSLFGLPRVMSVPDDVRQMFNAVPSEANGLTLCAGSFGARGDNDLVQMVSEFGSKIYFVHLRNVKREDDGSFYESDHLDGDNDMLGLIDALLLEESQRRLQGDKPPIPMRPDHGLLIGDEMKDVNVKPGYSYMGRLKGLAELRGVIFALEKTKAY